MSFARMHRAGALAALVLGSFVFGSLHATLPPIGSGDVAIADPDIPPPTTTPCVVPLYDDLTFIGFDPQMFTYTPPSDCPGPWQKVVLSADFDVTVGRQFDRTAEIWLGGANIYYGTTEEPRATVAPTWHIERDLTDYSVLFTQAQNGRVDLGNQVDDTYTGIIHGSASLMFYPAVDTVFDSPPRPDVVLPLAADATGGTVTLNSFNDRLAATFSLPTNIRRAFLDVIAQSQNTDEFWYLCVPDDLADELQSCPGSGFREAEVTIDGLYVGVASVYPWIYTGGIDPGLWRPSPGIQTLSFQPYRVDLTPYAAWLSSGQPHEVGVLVFNAQPYFSATANLLLYRDHGASTVTGQVTTNTLNDPSFTTSNDISTATDGTITGTVTVGSTRDFEISGYADTSDGRITTDIQQHIVFSNAQTFDIGSATYSQSLTQDTTVDTTTSVDTGTYSHVVTEHTDWPLSVDYAFDVAADNSSAQTTSIEQGLQRNVEVNVDGYSAAGATLAQDMTTADTVLFDSGGNQTGRTAQSSQQSYDYADDFGTCYNRTITTANGVLTAVDDGANCPEDTNILPWFDSFSNRGSSIFGATVQILP